MWWRVLRHAVNARPVQYPKAMAAWQCPTQCFTREGDCDMTKATDAVANTEVDMKMVTMEAVTMEAVSMVAVTMATIKSSITEQVSLKITLKEVVTIKVVPKEAGLVEAVPMEEAPMEAGPMETDAMEVAPMGVVPMGAVCTEAVLMEKVPALAIMEILETEANIMEVVMVVLNCTSLTSGIFEQKQILMAACRIRSN